MKILSLFDGISCGQVAFKRLGLPYQPYQWFASELDDYAIKITQKNFPDTVQLGDVNNWETWNLPKIDLLIGGSPCQDLSQASNNGKGLDGEKSQLFWKYVDVLNKIKPTYFILENVKPKNRKDEILMTNALGVNPILLDAGLVSAQRRKRLFWTNIPNIKQPKNKGLVIKDILEPNAKRRSKNISPDRIIQTSYGVRWSPKRSRQFQGVTARTTDKQSTTVTSNCNGQALIVKQQSSQPQGMSAQAARTTSKTIFVLDGLRIEQLTWTELERLMGLEDGYTDLGEENKVEARGRCIGNGMQVDIVEHILNYLTGFPEPLKRDFYLPTQESLFETGQTI